MLGAETVSPINPRPRPETMSPSALVVQTPRRLLIVPDSAPKNGIGSSAGSVGQPGLERAQPANVLEVLGEEEQGTEDAEVEQSGDDAGDGESGS